MNTIQVLAIGVLILIVTFLSISMSLENSHITRMHDQLIIERQELLEQRQRDQVELIQLINEYQFLVSEAQKVTESYDRKSSWQGTREGADGIPEVGDKAKESTHKVKWVTSGESLSVRLDTGGY